MSHMTSSRIQRLRAQPLPHAIPVRIVARRHAASTAGPGMRRIAGCKTLLLTLGIPASMVVIGVALSLLFSGRGSRAGEMNRQEWPSAKSQRIQARAPQTSDDPEAAMPSELALTARDVAALNARLMAAGAKLPGGEERPRSLTLARGLDPRVPAARPSTGARRWVYR